MKAGKYYYHTNDVIKDRLSTRIARRQDLLDKLERYDKEIQELEVELLKRGVSLKEVLMK